MKKLLSILMCLSLLSFSFYSCSSDDDDNGGNGGNGDEKYIDLAKIKDANFKNYCLDNFDKNKDGKLSEKEVTDVTIINISNKNISTLDGLELFVNVKKLICNDNNSLTSLNLGQNPKITYFEGLSLSKLESFNISNNVAIDTLILDQTNLKTIDLSKNRGLVYLKIDRSGLQELNLITNEKLVLLSCNNNKLGRLDVTNNPNLESLACSGNLYITNLDLSKNTNLKELGCSHNDIGELLNIQYNRKLKVLSCTSNDRMKYLYVWKDFDSKSLSTFLIPSQTEIREAK